MMIGLPNDWGSAESFDIADQLGGKDVLAVATSPDGYVVTFDGAGQLRFWRNGKAELSHRALDPSEASPRPLFAVVGKCVIVGRFRSSSMSVLEDARHA